MTDASDAAAARAERSDQRLSRLTSRLSAATQIFFIFLAAGVLIALGVMVRDAFRSPTVIVEPFDAPAALAERGLTDKVLASHLLDEPTRLTAGTRSAAAKRNLSNAWTSDIKVEVPQTGISIGEIDRLLTARFGGTRPRPTERCESGAL